MAASFIRIVSALNFVVNYRFGLKMLQNRYESIRNVYTFCCFWYSFPHLTLYQSDNDTVTCQQANLTFVPVTMRWCSLNDVT